MPEDTRQFLGADRRTLMKALGAGATLSAFGGSALAQEGGTGADGGTGAERGGTAETGTVHRVETHIGGPPTNPERPADFFYQPTGLHVRPGDVVKFVFVTPDHNVVSMHPAFGMRRRVPTGVEAFSSPLKGWKPSSVPGDRIEPFAEPGGEGEGAEGANGGGGGGGTPTPTPGQGSGDAGSDGESASCDGPGPVPDTWLHAFETPGVYDIVCSPHEAFGMAMRVVVGDVTGAPFETEDPADLPEPRAGPVGLARVTLTDPALQPSNVVQEGTVAWESLAANRGGGSGSEGGSDSGGGEDATGNATGTGE